MTDAKPTKNFNSKQMKLAFFDDDEYDKELCEMSLRTKQNLFEAFDYTWKRSSNKNTSVKVFVVLAPTTRLDGATARDFTNHVKSKGANFLSSTEDSLVVGTEEGHTLTLRFIGGYKFIFDADDEDLQSLASADSNFQDLNNQGLTQECNLDK